VAVQKGCSYRKDTSLQAIACLAVTPENVTNWGGLLAWCVAQQGNSAEQCDQFCDCHSGEPYITSDPDAALFVNGADVSLGSVAVANGAVLRFHVCPSNLFETTREVTLRYADVVKRANLTTGPAPSHS
jgi:hypothetical protein